MKLDVKLCDVITIGGMYRPRSIKVWRLLKWLGYPPKMGDRLFFTRELQKFIVTEATESSTRFKVPAGEWFPVIL